MKNKRANESLDANAEVLEKKRDINRKYMKNKRSLGQMHDSEPCTCNSTNKRVCRENKIIHEHSIGQNNELQKSSGPSDNTQGTVLSVSLPENLKVSKHNETTIKNFVKELSNYPEYTCIMCKMLFFSHLVSEVTNDGNKKSYVCKSVCQKHFFKNDYSNTAERNFLYTGDLPENLCDINPTECRLIAQRFMFMKIKLLPAGGQRSISGPIVNVPVDPQENCLKLPRKLSDIGTLPVRLKPRIYIIIPKCACVCVCARFI